jgi:replicative DNA helicase
MDVVERAQPQQSFGQFGKFFQEKLVHALLVDPKYAEQMTEVIDVDYFEVNYLKFLADRYFKYALKYKAYPSLPLLVTIVKDDLKTGTDALLKTQVVDYLQRMRSNPDVGDLEFVKERSLEFCRKQALKKALEAAVDQLQENKYEAIVESIKRAVQVGTAPSMGHDFFNEMDARFARVKRDTITTGLPEFDKKDILNGGSGKGELHCVIGATGAGKCSVPDTYVHVKYTAVRVNESLFKPWDVIHFHDESIRARDVTFANTSVTSIAHEAVEETLTLGDLFSQIGFDETASASDDTGDSYIENEWPIEIMSLDGYYPIEGFRWTRQEEVVELSHTTLDDDEEDVPVLRCAPDHLVLKRFTPEESQWTRVKDLRSGDVIVSSNSLRRVLQVKPLRYEQRLCDVQVAIAHSYLTDGILSHNSHFLTMIGANALTIGANVLHYSFELSETSVGVRYDSNLCDIDASDVLDNRDKVQSFYEGNSGLGRLFIKEYPTGMASVHTLRAHIERLGLKGFRPDMVIVDYADIMRSSRQFDSLRHELKLVYEELRGLAMELKVPIWTASQSNKEGANADVIDMTNMSEAYGKAMICDFIVSISRRAHEKSTGWGRLYVAKNRAGRDGLVFTTKIDTARSRFTISNETEMGQEQPIVSSDESLKAQINRKWRELSKELPREPEAI